MPMPSLFKYFAFVGACLLALLTLTNFLLDPSTVVTSVAPPKPAVAIQYDPRASKIERWRTEQAALKAAEQTPAGENASLVTKSAPEPYRPAAQAAPQAVQPVAQVEPTQSQPAPPAQMQSAETAEIVGVETEEEAAAARAAKLAEEKAKIAKAKARKARVARERARSTTETAMGDGGVPVAGYYGYARERTAANQQDQFYYGQRAGGPQAAPGYGYAQRQSYGPFGWGRGW